MNQHCEWCSESAIHKLKSPLKYQDYERYACDKHFQKTYRLTVLDGLEIITVSSDLDGYKVPNLDEKELDSKEN